MKIHRVIHDGAFGADVSRVLGSIQPIESVSLSDRVITRTENPDGATAVVLRGPVISDLLAIAQTLSGQAWLAAFPFERHIVVSSLFRTGRPCVDCFVRRWMSQPPEGYHPEVVSAIVTVVATSPDFEYQNLSPLAPMLTAYTLLESVSRDASYVLCLDQAGESVLSTQLRPLHGCVCRGKGGGDPSRFVRFSVDLERLIAMRTNGGPVKADAEVASW